MEELITWNSFKFEVSPIFLARAFRAPSAPLPLSAKQVLRPFANAQDGTWREIGRISSICAWKSAP